MKFKVGDRVKAIDSIDNPLIVGRVGTIVCYENTLYGVRFDEAINGHTCDNHCEYHHGWWCNDYDLVKVDIKIVITSDGETTTAKLYDGKKIVKTAMAKCSPEDKFNFEIGAIIAFNRLAVKANESEEKLLNTKFCVVEGDDTFKTGHVYEVVDGKILVPYDNKKYPIESSLHSKQELLDYFAPYTKRVAKRGWSGKGIKIVEVVDD